MRKLLPLLAVAVLFSTAGIALAAGDKTITGDAVCAKCALKEKATCQNVVLVEEGGKTVKYFLDGPESKKAHGALGICTASKDAPIKVKVSGTCEKKGEELVITVSKIEKAN
ncbi:MAG: DUF6370 family protein [Isosphaeraceae bacterium]